VVLDAKLRAADDVSTHGLKKESVSEFSSFQIVVFNYND